MSVRTVRRLRVRAGSGDDARHAAVLLGDALRTASLPFGDDGRLVVVRHLPLGRIPRGVGPVSLALHIERVARDLLADAVTYDGPAAATANVVVFPNPAAAVIAAARVLGSDAPADEWFWPRVVPGWSETARVSRWPLLIEAAHHVPGSPVVAAAVVLQALRSAGGHRFLSSIAAGDAARWLRAAGWPEWSPRSVRVTPPRVTPFRAAAIAAWRQRWRATDDRLVWLGSMLAVHENPSCAGDSGLPARIAGSLRDDAPALLARAPETRPSPIDPAPRAAEDVPAFRDPTARVATPEATQQRRAAARGTSDDSIAGAPAPALQVDQPAATMPEPSPGVEVVTPHAAGAFTGFAGLLLVVPILERLGFAAFVAADPQLLDAEFPARLFWSIGRRVGMPPDDPLSLTFEREAAGEFPLRDSATLPAAARQVLATPPPRAAMQSAVDAWTVAVRRWCRRHARQGLISLIRRPARVHTSRTHIDIAFHLSQVDAQVRRLALDVDPGWVPWLGQVVHFRYLERQ